MNERNRELAERAKLRPALLLKLWGTIDALTDSEQEELEQIELFAELIVKECAQIAFQNDIAKFTRDGYRIGLDIQKHFGVE